MRADGSGQPERLTRAAAYYDKIAYTRDGSRIMAVRGSRQQRMRNFEDFGSLGGGAELEYVTIPAAGGDATRVTWIGAGASQEGRNVPHIGPDSTRMYVWAGTEGLVSMRFDGTDRKVSCASRVRRRRRSRCRRARRRRHRRRPTKCCSRPTAVARSSHADNNVYLISGAAGRRPGAGGLGDGGLGRADGAPHESRRRFHRLAERQSHGVLLDRPQLLQLRPRARRFARARLGCARRG